jgi:hypothetical protein
MQKYNGKPLVFLSYDIEADGPSVGLASMLNFGMVGITVDKERAVVFEYEANLEPLPGMLYNLSNNEFWNRPEQKDALEYISKDRREPCTVMTEVALQLAELGTRYEVIPVAWPAAFDWPWINYYMWRFANGNPLGYSSNDLGSYDWAVSKSIAPVSFDMDGLKKTLEVPERIGAMPAHSGLVDAYYQGMAFVNAVLSRVG